MNGFREAYEVLSKVYGTGARLKQALAETPLEREHALAVKTAYGVLENDGYLSLCIRTFAEKPPKSAVRIVLKIALYHLVFLGKPRYAVTDGAVELVKGLGKGGAAGFVNAFLRSFEEDKIVLPEGEEGLVIRSNFPRFAVREITENYGARAERILTAKTRGVTVRFQRNMEKYLTLPHEDTPFENVKIFPNFTRDEGFFRGDYTFQSVGSVAICGVVEPCARLLDACAAPGGKSVLLSEKCKEVTATELHAHRVKLIESYCSRMGAHNVTTRQADATVSVTEFIDAFDGVLCDVPCSGLGTAAENPDLPLNKKEEDMAGLTALQREILENCAQYVKRGGALYYSTCSLLTAENDGAVDAFLSSHSGFKTEEITSPLPHERTQYGLQFLPDTAFGAGFYIAKLRKL